VQSWEPGSTSPDEQVEMTRAGFAGGAERLDTVGIDESCLERLTDALGPITAW
jgi:hypothetical protein